MKHLISLLVFASFSEMSKLNGDDGDSNSDQTKPNQLILFCPNTSLSLSSHHLFHFHPESRDDEELYYFDYNFASKVGIVHRKKGKWINSGSRSTSSGSSWWCDDDQDGSTLLALLKTIPLFYYVTFPFRYYAPHTTDKKEYTEATKKSVCGVSKVEY